MKVFFSLIVFSFVLATCQGACFYGLFNATLIDGKPVIPDECVDMHDSRKHLIGSTWNTTECLRCECSKTGFTCCHRYDAIEYDEGCKTLLNPVTRKHEHYRLNDTSQRS